MNDPQRTRGVIERLYEFLERNGFEYEKDAAAGGAAVQLSGEDFPIRLELSVSDRAQRLDVYSVLTFGLRPERAADLARAVNFINGRTAGGKFALNLADETVCYIGSAFFAGAAVGDDFIKNLISEAYYQIETYNDQLYAVNRGLLTVKEFMIQNGADR
ncbi:MAG: YbjN domain-containing protein [Clostridiales bacterium]|jgi:hypothetical protein|nr:YbjN domain-containing protein [Clostridiales bacterium]